MTIRQEKTTSFLLDRRSALIDEWVMAGATTGDENALREE
jgi:hypothetical protein